MPTTNTHSAGGTLSNLSAEITSLNLSSKNMFYGAVLVSIMVLQIVSCDTWEDIFRDIGCQGRYDRYIMAHLQRTCDECYDLTKEQDIHFNCRRKCFGTITFFKCLITVALSEERIQQVYDNWNSNMQISEEGLLLYKDGCPPRVLTVQEELSNLSAEITSLNLSSKNMFYGAVLVFIMVLQIVSCDPWEDTFQSVGCKGRYDKYKMAHLERICDECYELYKQQDIHLDCRSHCFGSGTFFKCMETVALSELRKQQVMHSWNRIRQMF